MDKPKKSSDRTNDLPYNRLALIRLGVFPPDVTPRDIRGTFIWKFWDVFRDYCRFAKINEKKKQFKIRCKEVQRECKFSVCPILSKTIKGYNSS
ncbi:MAG: hypothetical protein GWO20_19375 [Candidatus Korarchaeota archaeon]|nr:hypothetical protein [Candidatus Korarchaeota archaeon]NIU85415.1 hypothetical protein [Candidatus Thorarchaeota archaeon]NIW15512.1 hypothetical protein [Candidatus Thorarchaeota archaeon]NIW53457.1 hypothetical protein [Candidatus Korarchaeota archaeon]